MSTEIILAIVLATLFLGAIACLVIYSRLQHRKTVRAEQQLPAGEPSAATSWRRTAAQ